MLPRPDAQIFTLIVGTICIEVPAALAGPIRWDASQGGNGHLYELVLTGSPIGWDAAKAACEARGGHLATITSAAENDFVANLVVAGGRNAFLGGYQIDPSAPADVGWTWVTGEAWSYTNWAGGEPNDQGSPSEWVLEMWTNRQWNDVPNAGSGYAEYAYVFESVPAPGAATLVSMALLSSRRRTR